MGNHSQEHGDRVSKVVGLVCAPTKPAGALKGGCSALVGSRAGRTLGEQAAPPDGVTEHVAVVFKLVCILELQENSDVQALCQRYLIGLGCSLYPDTLAKCSSTGTDYILEHFTHICHKIMGRMEGRNVLGLLGWSHLRKPKGFICLVTMLTSSPVKSYAVTKRDWKSLV